MMMRGEIGDEDEEDEMRRLAEGAAVYEYVC